MIGVPAIFCTDPSSISETFVRRHIWGLNSGDTMVFGEVYEDLTGDLNFPNYEGILASPRLSMRRALRFLHSIGLPFMINKRIWKNLIGFPCEASKISYLLFEFGYIFARHYDFALFSEKPFFVYFRGQDASKLLGDEAYVSVLRSILPRANGVVFVSEALRQNLRSLNIDLPRSEIIPSGVETHEFRPAKKRRLSALSVGRFVSKKGHADTVRAVRLIVEKCPGFHLEFIGDGPLREEIEALVHELELDRNVSFSGALVRSEVARRMASAQFYFQSSKTAPDGDSEGFPSAIQEAMASGCVVLTTAHAGASDFLLDGENAFLHPEGDFESLAQNFLSSHKDIEVLNRIAQCARALAVLEFDANICLRKFESFVDACVKDQIA